MKSIKIRSQGKWYWRVNYLGWSLACAIAWPFGRVVLSAVTVTGLRGEN